MITQVLTEEGKLITIEDALIGWDLSRAMNKPDPIYMDTFTGDTLIKPRKGSDTPLVKRQAHFYHPSKFYEKGIGKERFNAIKTLESILQSTGEFKELDKGMLGFYDLSALEHDALKPDFDYGFQVLWAKHNNNTEYALLVLNRVPNSKDYLNMLSSMGTKEESGGELKIKKILIKKNKEKKILGDKLHLATIQFDNRHLYRLNKENVHSKDALMLGDWQSFHLANIYPEFTYFNPEEKSLNNIALVREPHNCSYSHYRYEFKKRKEPEEGSEFCRFALSEKFHDFALEPFEIKKNQLKGKIGEHSRLYLARFVPLKQIKLF